MESPIPYGTVVSAGGDSHVLTFTLRFPQSVEEVWAAVAGPDGLRTWLAAADPFVQREGGAITLRWLNGDEYGAATVASGQVTCWGPARLAEYTVDVHGRIRFELRADPDHATGTLLLFTNALTVPDSAVLGRLAGWHQHFEFLAEALAGRPVDWSTWTLDRWRALYGAYERAL
ncbi:MULTISPECIES: SRPBCC domain-containing protein [Streptomyces]|uniref:SRPBCC domain-containing protein n=1 Tax=Streptomyces TaxID=1883 RepID=UPI000B9E61B0|nr:SRPBCC domain-containing protein [Streptomyces kasugaensis]WSK14102.1 SRPBCC domain-containing protein [Streptomyces celluloflavus]